MAWAVFVDFDGTITDVDTFDVFVRRFAGAGAWLEIEARIERNDLSLRDALALEASYVRVSLDEADAVLRDIVRIDPAFAPFVAHCEARGARVVVVSSGIEPLIERALARSGLARLEVIANPVTVDPAGWRIDFRDGSDNGNDKAALVRAAAAAGFETLFVGDGRSDYDAALAAQRRFAKRGGYLEGYLERRGVAFESFSSFAEVTAAW